MTPADIAHAKARAEDVINGFVQVRITQARDVVRLAEELQRTVKDMQRTIDDMKREKPGDFGNVFEELMKGKKP